MYHVVANEAEFIVVHKAPGVSFHSESGEMGLFETVKQQEKLPTLFPVHRLDKVTSGLLVMAKTTDANTALCRAFAERRVDKYYLAISHKKPTKKQGLISGDMAQARRGAWKLLPTQENPAITQFFSRGMGEGQRLFIVKPHSGKTHQIRVALKSVGAPIWGDTLYGGEHAIGGHLPDRCYLHAYSLGFTLNTTYYRYTEMPVYGGAFTKAEWHEAVGEFATPWDLPWPTISKKAL
jgi:tRNA pseudouridine32 synthase/23S rRNA pseudouridine746 synthase